MRGRKTLGLVAAAAVGALGAATSASAADDGVLAISAPVLHVGDGTVIENAIILIEDGRIIGVGPGLAVPGGATRIEARGAHVTPGLIDANARIESGDLITPEATAGTLPSWMQPTAEYALTTHTHEDGVSHDEHDHEHGHSEHVHDASCSVASCAACLGSATCASCRSIERCTICGHRVTGEHEGDDCPVCDGPLANPIELPHSCPGCGGPNIAIVQQMAMQEPLAAGVSNGWVQSEASSEVVPHTTVIDGLNLFSPDFKRLVREGVTTVYAAPDTSAVIGPRGAIVKTAGSLRGRVLEPEADVQATIGADPYRVGLGNAPPFRGFVTDRTRRPTTRMGVVWVLRKAFSDADKFARGLEVGGADTAEPVALEIVNKVRSGEIPLRIHARTQSDIFTALRLAEEFDLRFTLVEGTESYRAVEALKAAGVPVIFGPVYDEPTGLRRFTNESGDSKPSTPAALDAAGLDFALTAQDMREEEGLVRQGAFAVRAGLSPERALRAMTQTPARMLGIDDRVGTVEAGKAADLVIWSDEPFSPASRALVVIVDGRVVVDRR